MLIPGTHGRFYKDTGTVLPQIFVGGGTKGNVFLLDDLKTGGIPGNHPIFKGLNLDPSRLYSWIAAHEEQYFVPDIVLDNPAPTQRSPIARPPKVYACVRCHDANPYVNQANLTEDRFLCHSCHDFAWKYSDQFLSK